MSKAKYTATRLVQHDGKDYHEGDDIILTEEQAASLLAVGAVAKRGKPTAADGETSEADES